MLRPAVGLLVCCLLAQARALELSLPTDNTALFETQPQSFYMGVDRSGERVWQGGAFGFTRSPLTWPGGTVFTQFHEGIDIAPVRRQANGLPMDEVRAMSPGTVVLCEEHGRSQYGNQVVVRHDWDDGSVFSRYAHLQSVQVAINEQVKAGQTLGVMGYTGGALSVERAHLHLEINLMLNETCEQSWLPSRARATADPKFHPANMAGIDAAALFVELRANPKLSFTHFVTNRPAYFTVAATAGQTVDLLRRHPWLAKGKTQARGWKVSFTEWGLPVRFEPLDEPPPRPQVTWVQPFEGKHTWRTGGLLSGTGGAAVLGAGGEALIRFILGQP